MVVLLRVAAHVFKRVAPRSARVFRLAFADVATTQFQSSQPHLTPAVPHVPLPAHHTCRYTFALLPF